MTVPLIFATQSYRYLADELAAVTDWEVGSIVNKAFPDGEHYYRIETSPADRDVVLVGGTISETDTLELYDLACGIVGDGAYRLRLVLPFFGYSTMERAVRPGEVVTAKTRARLLSSIPVASRGTQVFMLDLHVSAIAYYFEGGVRPVHMYGKPLVLEAARQLGGRDFVLACTDAGRAKWVESLANDLDVPAAFVYKRRIDGANTAVTGVSAQVQGKSVVIYDDMIRTGGSLLSAAQAYRDAGAATISAIATHGLFPEDSAARLRASGLFERVVVTNSHPRARALQDDFLAVQSIAPLLAKHLQSNR